MKILIDLGHAGHVHYYKNLILNRKYSDLEFLVVARKRDPIPELLDSYKIRYIDRGKGRNSKLGKILYLIYGNLFILYWTIKFKPNVLLSHGGTYTAISSLVPGVNSITTEDTDSAKFSHWISKLFSSHILTPKVFNLDLGKNHVKFDSYMEYAYLHSSRFNRNPKVLKKYQLNEHDKFVVIRFVDWQAHHDYGIDKLSLTSKLEIVNELSKSHKIILSHESHVPDELKEFTKDIDAKDLHHLLAYASLYIGEGATTASEASILGTPAIYINPMQVCYCRDQEEKYQLSFNMTEKKDILTKSYELLKIGKSEFENRAVQMENDKVDTTEFLYGYIKQLKI